MSPYGNRRGNDQDAVALCIHIERFLGSRFHPDDGDFVLVAQFPHGHAGSGIAGDDDGLDIFGHEKGKGIADVLEYLFCRLCPIRYIVFIGEKDELFMREYFHGMMEDAEPAYAGIEKCNFHIKDLGFPGNYTISAYIL